MFHRCGRHTPIRARPWLGGWSSGSTEQRGMRAQLMIAGSRLYPQQQVIGSVLRTCAVRSSGRDVALMYK
jgi:hypothetical protein